LNDVGGSVVFVRIQPYRDDIRAVRSKYRQHGEAGVPTFNDGANHGGRKDGGRVLIVEYSNLVVGVAVVGGVTVVAEAANRLVCRGLRAVDGKQHKRNTPVVQGRCALHNGSAQSDGLFAIRRRQWPDGDNDGAGQLGLYASIEGGGDWSSLFRPRVWDQCGEGGWQKSH
jgi:hypothetical protein